VAPPDMILLVGFVLGLDLDLDLILLVFLDILPMKKK
jgi:hypothetical protein